MNESWHLFFFRRTELVSLLRISSSQPSDSLTHSRSLFYSRPSLTPATFALVSGLVSGQAAQRLITNLDPCAGSRAEEWMDS